jgi:hypothetical protein
VLEDRVQERRQLEIDVEAGRGYDGVDERKTRIRVREVLEETARGATSDGIRSLAVLVLEDDVTTASISCGPSSPAVA